MTMSKPNSYHVLASLRLHAFLKRGNPYLLRRNHFFVNIKDNIPPVGVLNATLYTEPQ